MTLEESCRFCTCEELSQSQSCTEFYPAPAPCRSEKKKISPGESIEWNWNGTYYSQRQRDSQSCKTKTIPDRDKTFQATFCWSASREASANTSCKTVAFEYGEDVVEKRIELKKDKPKRQKDPVTFRLKNRGDSPVSILESEGRCDDPSHCEGKKSPHWLKVSRNNNSRISLKKVGQICTCEEIASTDQCQRLETPSSLGSVTDRKRLEPGESVEWRWDGVYYASSQRNGKSCKAKRVPHEDAKFSADLCWSEAMNGYPDGSCETVEFDYGRDVVEKTIGNGDDSDADNSRTTEFVLKRHPDRPSRGEIRIPRRDCYSSQSPGWINVYDGSQTLRIDIDQTSRRCSKPDANCHCPISHGGCGFFSTRSTAPSPWKVIEPGDEVSWRWDGKIFNREDEVGACFDSSKPALGKKLRVEMCYKLRGPRGGENAGEGDWTVSCSEQQFRVGTDKVITRLSQFMLE